MSFVIFSCLIGLLLTAYLAFTAGKRAGYEKGYDQAQNYWESLRKIPVAGQTLYLPGFGDVMILGRGSIEGVPHIDYISSSYLAGRSPAELSEDEIGRNCISCPLDNFVVQCENSIKDL